MKVLQLCCFTNLWPSDFKVFSVDLKTGGNVMDLSLSSGKEFDLVVAAPPCTQFTKANSPAWSIYPENDVLLARKCFDICIRSGGFWFMENPPGRIETFIPELKFYRVLTWSGFYTNKEYIVYSNFMILNKPVRRYGKANISRSKLLRESWQPDFIDTIVKSL